MAKAIRAIASRSAQPKFKTKRRLDVLRDVPDIRDRLYEPTLRPLPSRMKPPTGLAILDQGEEGACTGFALAATINILLGRAAKLNGGARMAVRRVSPYMLYDMARRHDEWPGNGGDGSSPRGALRGFFNAGACAEKFWSSPQPNRKSAAKGKAAPQPAVPVGFVSLAAAEDARKTALGAYYRLRPHLPDYHAAISETGVIYASAAVHGGWDDPKKGIIPDGKGTSLHAFAIVGYDDTGFWVQNSWGKDWGNKGLAHWSYKDWASNIEDAWVLQLAVQAPTAFGLGISRGNAQGAAEIARVKRARPVRNDIAGHFVHVDDGAFVTKGNYWSNHDDVAATADLLAGSDKYQHLLFIVHGGLNSADEAAIRTAAMVNVFKANGIYPYSVIYETGLMETLKDSILGRGGEVTQRTGGLLDITDALIERAVGPVGTRLWREMKGDARRPFETGGAGETSINLFAQALARRTKPAIKVHVLAHSLGSVLTGHFLSALDRLVPGGFLLDSCSLMAPACSLEFFNDKYLPHLSGGGSKVSIAKTVIYALTDSDEQCDTVTPLYNKSLLYLVSNALEEKDRMPLLGMQAFHGQLGPAAGKLQMIYAEDPQPCQSKTHGGFDNDPPTMNNVLKTVLGKAPSRPFSIQDLDF